MTARLAPARWYRLLPVAFITYSLAYLDRANFGFGVASGMAADLQITPTMSSLLGSLFFLGYFFFQVPGAIYAENRSARKLIFWSLIIWGALAMATGIVSNVVALIGIRFMLGVVEGAVMPAMLLLLGRWFTRAERAKANTFLILGNPTTILWMSVLSGYLVQAVGWRWMFIIEGFPALVWAFFWWRLVNDKSEQARWLTDFEKQSLSAQLADEQRNIKPVKNYAAAFKSGIVMALCAQYFLWHIGLYGFVMWLPSILNAAPDMTIVKTGWLSAVPYVVAIFGMVTVSRFSDRNLNRKTFVWPFMLIGAVAFFGSYLVGASNFWLSYSLFLVAGGAMYAPYGPFFALILDVLPTNVAGGAVGLVNSFGALGSFTGTYIVGYLNGTTSDFGASYLFMAGSLLLATLIMLLAVRQPKIGTFVTPAS